MSLTPCQGWILTQLCLIAEHAPIETTDFAEALHHDLTYTERYLRELEGLGLVRTHQISGALAWRPSSDGVLLGTAL